MIFQDPYSSLNPRQTIGAILTTPLKVHGLHHGKEKARVQELLELVGLNPEHINRYPSEFSGGQRQRIARALAVEPKIIADEPVSALDVSIQAQVMNLLSKLRNELDLAFIFVAHDLGVVRHFCDQVAVMYLGKIVEYGDKKKIYELPSTPTPRRCSPLHPTSTSRAASPQGAHPSRRRRPEPDRPPERLSLPHALLEGPGHLRAGGAAAPRRDPDEGRGRREGGLHLQACHFPEVKTELVAAVEAH